MADLKFQAVAHDHKAFLEKAAKRQGFGAAYEALEVEYALAHEMLAARVCGYWQDGQRRASDER